VQFYGDIGKADFRYADLIHPILKLAGIAAMDPKRSSCPVTFLVEINGEALTAQYSLGSLLLGSRYSGANIRGKVSFVLSDIPVVSEEFSGEISPPNTISSNVYTTPDQAPFYRAFIDSGYPEACANILGKQYDYNFVNIGFLAEGMANNSLQVRRFVVKIIENLCDSGKSLASEQITLLIKGVQSPDDDRRTDYIRMLGKSGDPRAVEPLRSCFSDKSSVVRAAALRALQNFKDGTNEDLFILGLKDYFNDVRKAALEGLVSRVEVLNQEGVVGAVEPLIECLRDERWEVRSLAVEALGKIGDPKAVPGLVALLDRADQAEEVAIVALGRIITTDSVKALLARYKPIADSKNFSRDMKIKEVVEGIDNPEAIPGAIEGLAMESDDSRRGAVIILAKIGGKAIEPLLDALKHRNEKVRSGAACALGKLGENVAVEPLIIALKDSSWEVRREAAFALGALNDPRAVDPLLACLMDNNREVRYKVAHALGNIGDLKALKPLIGRLKDEDLFVREFAAEALGKLGNSTAVKPLIACLNDEDESVRCASAEALGAIGDKKAIEALEKLMADKSVYVRKAAEEALNKLKNTK
jgi:HEAT repeat protein